ncbi:MAG: NAD(P)H-dependent oxidoreductase [Saprospiraceae bacterium]|nr:NAD(P)H-dependent oxidoreductase [Saprospiraceae bacterium]
MKILAISGTNSCYSINEQLLIYLSKQVKQLSVELVPYTTFNLPIYSIDMEQFVGIPDSVQFFAQQLRAGDGLILSIPEHNGNVTAYFKNLIDWLSRTDHQFLRHTKIFLLITSNQLVGSRQVLQIMNDCIPSFGGEITAQLSLGGFQHAFADGVMLDPKIETALQTQLWQFIQSLSDHNQLIQAS